MHHLHLTNYPEHQPKTSTTRDGFGQGLLELGEENQQVVGLCADLTRSMRMDSFEKKYPERFFQLGVAEENMTGVSAGLALADKIPVAGSFAVFNPSNSLGVIRASICYSDLNVNIAGGHAGLATGADGATHQALEDIAVMRTLPNMRVVVACDYQEARKAIKALCQDPHPGYLRIGKAKTPHLTTEKTPFELGKAMVFKEGSDVTLIATGLMVTKTLEAAWQLEKMGVSAQVINLHTIKPLDIETVIQAVGKTKHLITIEEHQKAGGMGSAVAEALAEHQVLVPHIMLGVDDTFGESGQAEELLTKYGLSTKDIVAKAQEVGLAAK